MKKLLVLFVVLAMTQVASAAMLELWIVSLNGLPIDPVKDITIEPSDVINIDIILTGAVEDGALFSLDVDITAAGLATLDVTALTPGDAAWSPFYSTEVPVAGGYQIIRLNDTAPKTVDPTSGQMIALDHILLHCDGEPDVVTMTLAENGGAGGTMLVDPITWANIGQPSFGPGLTITQVPEPMTIALLGLGGLFLLRRRK